MKNPLLLRLQGLRQRDRGERLRARRRAARLRGSRLLGGEPHARAPDRGEPSGAGARAAAPGRARAHREPRDHPLPGRPRAGREAHPAAGAMRRAPRSTAGACSWSPPFTRRSRTATSRPSGSPTRRARSSCANPRTGTGRRCGRRSRRRRERHGSSAIASARSTSTSPSMTRWRPGVLWFAKHAPKLVAIAKRAAALDAVAPVIARNFG